MKRRRFLQLLGLAPVVPLVAKGMVEEKPPYFGETVTVNISEDGWFTGGLYSTATHGLQTDHPDNRGFIASWSEGGDMRLTVYELSDEVKL